MAPRSKIIGNDGLEQGGDNLGNDYSRNITREKQANDTLNIVVPKGKKNQQKKEEKKEQHERFPQHPPKK